MDFVSGQQSQASCSPLYGVWPPIFMKVAKIFSSPKCISQNVKTPNVYTGNVRLLSHFKLTPVV